MVRDLHDVVNKIIVAISDYEPTPQEIAALGSDLATFFDASVVLVYFGKMPLSFPTEPSQTSSSQNTAAAIGVIEEEGRRIIDRMAEAITAEGVPVSSRFVMGAGTHAIRDIIEKEQADLVVLPSWSAGVTSRLARVFSPSILEDATCPVLVLKGTRWATKSKAARPSQTNQPRRDS